MWECGGGGYGADNNTGELEGATQGLLEAGIDRDVNFLIDSTYVIQGWKTWGELPLRKKIRSSNRAEWGKFHQVLQMRKGKSTVAHVRSHPRYKETGEDLKWEDMTFEQRMNSLADKEAEKGREGETGVVFDFPVGEMDFALFHKGDRVMGDARKHIITVHREGLKSLMEGGDSVYKRGKQMGAWGEEAQSMLKGWRGDKAQCHMMKMLFESHKTTSHWFKAYRKEFSREYQEGPRDNRGDLNLSRGEYTCMRCPCCREGIEDRMHVLSTCGGQGRVGIIKHMVARLETILREAWPAMGD